MIHNSSERPFTPSSGRDSIRCGSVQPVLPSVCGEKKLGRKNKKTHFSAAFFHVKKEADVCVFFLPPGCLDAADTSLPVVHSSGEKMGKKATKKKKIKELFLFLSGKQNTWLM